MQMHEIKEVILRLFLLTWLISICASENCNFDSDCPAFANCDWSYTIGNRCKCDNGGSYSDDQILSCDAPGRTAVIAGSIIGTIVFIIIVVTACCIVRRRRRLAHANPVIVCIQPAPFAQQVPFASRTPQAVYPVQQYQQTAPPYPGYNNAGYGSNQPPPYSAVERK